MLRWLIRVAVSATVVALLVKIVPLPTIVDALGRVSVWAWLVSVVVFFLGHYCNAMKLRLLLGHQSVPLSACVRAQYVGLVANLGLPGLAGGDLARGVYLAPVVGTRRVALASAADRMIDTLAVVTMVAAAVSIAGAPPALRVLTERVVWWVVGPGAVALVVAVVLLTVKKRDAIASQLTRRAKQLRAFQAAALGAFAISLLVQAAFVLTNMWLARQVGVTTGASAWFVAWPLAKLVAVLPISLGGIGVREAALVSLLAPYGAPREAVLASGILWQGVLVVTGLVGLLFTQLLPRPVVPAAVEFPPSAYEE